jgi:heme/copper-type cytochrome/quinol oxidase subunit 2
VSAIVHLLLAVVLTLFLALQARSVLVVVRHRRMPARTRGRADLLWTCIPVAIVLFLAARSWVTVFGLAAPTPAAAVTPAEPVAMSGVGLPR